MSKQDQPETDESGRPRRNIQLVALEPRFLRRSIFLVLVGVFDISGGDLVLFLARGFSV